MLYPSQGERKANSKEKNKQENINKYNNNRYPYKDILYLQYIGVVYFQSPKKSSILKVPWRNHQHPVPSNPWGGKT